MIRSTAKILSVINDVPQPSISGHFLNGSTTYPCPEGSYGVDGRTCHPCPFASWSPSVGQTHCGRSFAYSYSASSARQLLYIPFGVTAINARLWGGGGEGVNGGEDGRCVDGGEGESDHESGVGRGRGGSYTSCNVSVTMNQNVYVIVGRGGRSSGPDGDGTGNVAGECKRPW